MATRRSNLAVKRLMTYARTLGAPMLAWTTASDTGEPIHASKNVFISANEDDLDFLWSLASEIVIITGVYFAE